MHEGKRGDRHATHFLTVDFSNEQAWRGVGGVDTANSDWLSTRSILLLEFLWS